MIEDFNAEFGQDSRGITLTGDAVQAQMVRTVLLTQRGHEPFRLQDGSDIESLLKEPPTIASAERVYLLIIDALQYSLPGFKLDPAQSSVIPADDGIDGSYLVRLYINNSLVQFVM